MHPPLIFQGDRFGPPMRRAGADSIGQVHTAGARDRPLDLPPDLPSRVAG